MEKPRKTAERAAKRPAAKLPATSESAESTLNDLDFQERFVDFYRGEIDRGGWLVEEKSYPLVALQAFRRWLRSQEMDVTTTKRPRGRAPKRRFRNGIEFLNDLLKWLQADYAYELRNDLGDFKLEILCRALVAALSRYGLKIQISSPTPIPARERALIKSIDSQLDKFDWQRYHKLNERCEDESLTPAEQKEFLKLVATVEKHHVQRLRAVEALSRLRGEDFFEVLDDFGLGKPSDD